MKVLVTGGAGFLGRKLIERLLDKGSLAGANGAQETISKIIAFDQVALSGDLAADPRVEAVSGDISSAADLQAVLGTDTGSIFHLAAVVSGAAEADIDLGLRVNLDGTRLLLDLARQQARPPRLVFASSIAVYGGELPETVEDDTPIRPQTSYGAQKVMGEYLITDYSRKGLIDGRAMRLPTIVVRPGAANAAASSFASAIVREPLNGDDFVCPVRPESRMAIMSPRRVIDAFVHLHEIDGASLGSSRALLLPGLDVSMGATAEALERVAADRPHGKISFEVDPFIQNIVDGWPKGSYSKRAEDLGFKGDERIDDIIAQYIEDELDS